MLEEIHLRSDSVFDDGAVVQRLGVPACTLARARRDGRLRFAKRGNRIFYLGAWLLDWLKDDDRANTHDGGQVQ